MPANEWRLVAPIACGWITSQESVDTRQEKLENKRIRTENIWGIYDKLSGHEGCDREIIVRR